MTERRIRYKASRTAAEFHASTKPVRGFRGPVGSGKTVACVKEIMKLCKQQWPNASKERLSRWAIIRNTTPELKTTTLNTWSQWVPEEICPITHHPIIMGTLEFPMPDGTRVKAEILFLALDQEKGVRKLLSLEVSGVFINEAREVSFSVLKAARERIGRYPSWADNYTPECLPPGTEHPCKQKSVIMDTNRHRMIIGGTN